MRRSSKLFLTILFPLVLAAPGLSILLPVEPVEMENRRIDPPPELSLTSLFAPSFYRETLRYVRSANPMRQLLLRIGAGLDYWVFDDSPDPTRALKGTDDWLYYRPTIEQPCTTSPEVVIHNLSSFVKHLENEVPTVVITVAPSKFMIHPEHLKPEQAEISECARLASVRLRELLPEAQLGHYVDGWRIFEELKASGVQPYFRTDTHFNFEGSIPWMKALVEAVADIWDPKAVKTLGTTRWLGNIMTFIGLEEPEEAKHVVIDRGLRVDVRQHTGGINHYRHTHTSGQELVAGKTLIIGDSFLELPEASLVQYFSDVSTMDWRDDEGIEYLLEHATQSEVVIIEISELHIWSFFSDPRLEQELRAVTRPRP